MGSRDHSTAHVSGGAQRLLIRVTQAIDPHDIDSRGRLIDEALEPREHTSDLFGTTKVRQRVGD